LVWRFLSATGPFKHVVSAHCLYRDEAAEQSAVAISGLHHLHKLAILGFMNR
jgi:hypothetical protein